LLCVGDVISFGRERKLVSYIRTKPTEESQAKFGSMQTQAAEARALMTLSIRLLSRDGFRECPWVDLDRY
jgi:hypothetical protein